MRALDLFCGAGGASAGLVVAGYEVTGVDYVHQPNYLRSGASRFIQADAFESQCNIQSFDLIWASPPCQAFTAYKRRPYEAKTPQVDLIEKTRQLLSYTQSPTVIENVVGAPLVSNLFLCGSMFGLDVRRHRLFECNFPVPQPDCDHASQAPRFPPATNRQNLRRTVEVGVWRIPLETQHMAMGGCEWMGLRELSNAIPPAYSQWIGTHAKIWSQR